MSASATPAASGASGPTTTSSAATAPRGRDYGRTVERVHVGSRRTRGSAAIASFPGATNTLLTPGSTLSFQASACSRPPLPTIRMRVGITSAPAHAGIPGRRRMGRKARSMVWVRSGPTETSTIGTPACSSIAET